MSDKPKGPYTVWIDYGYEGWKFTDCQTLDEAVKVETYGSASVIQKPVEYKVTENE